MLTATTEAPEQTTTRRNSAFDPSRYLTKLTRRVRAADGSWQTVEQDYMEVKWRLLWLRTEHPEARIETQLVRLEDGLAVFRAHVVLPTGAESTGWGSETADDWRDYIEKAETKALGRALAALGFGTQFCEDFDFSSGQADRFVDAPVTPPARGETVETGEHAPVQPRSARGGAQRQGTATPLATEPQIKAIYAIARSAQAMDEAQTTEWCRARYGVPPAELTRRQASELIDALKLGQAS